MLSWNRYGKASVRLVKVVREPDAHHLVDLTIDVQLEGAFESVYAGDNRVCLPTDTMKNTVYALARQPFGSMEDFALRLADHFAAKPAVSSARIGATQAPWTRLDVNDRPHPHAFARDGGEKWTTIVTRDASGARVVSGLTDLVVLKSSDSAFAGFPRDEYTTLPDTTDRLFATSITATWTYRSPAVDAGARALVRSALLETFATHVSESVQHTLAAMGEAALAVCPSILDITLTLPNRHHLLVDLRPFGLDNPNEIFVATEQPYGLIEATIRR
jgi:urate oxidase